MDWAAIVRTHGPQATRTAYRILGHAVDTEDAVQAAFMDAVRVARKGGVGTWGALMGHLATCRALDLLRRRHGKLGESLNGRDFAGDARVASGGGGGGPGAGDDIAAGSKRHCLNGRRRCFRSSILGI